MVFHEFVPITTQIGYGLDGVYNPQVASAPGEPALWQTPLRGMLIALVHDPRLNEAQLSDRLTSMALHYIGDHPLYPLRVAFWSAVRMLDLTGAGFERQQAYTEAYPPWLAVISVYAFWLLGLLAFVGIGAERATRRAPLAFWLCPILVRRAVDLLARGQPLSLPRGGLHRDPRGDRAARDSPRRVAALRQRGASSTVRRALPIYAVCRRRPAQRRRDPASDDADVRDREPRLQPVRLVSCLVAKCAARRP